MCVTRCVCVCVCAVRGDRAATRQRPSNLESFLSEKFIHNPHRAHTHTLAHVCTPKTAQLQTRKTRAMPSTSSLHTHTLTYIYISTSIYADARGTRSIRNILYVTAGALVCFVNAYVWVCVCVLSFRQRRWSVGQHMAATKRAPYIYVYTIYMETTDAGESRALYHLFNARQQFKSCLKAASVCAVRTHIHTY